MSITRGAIHIALLFVCVAGSGCKLLPWGGGNVQTGKASWYGGEYHGRATASGETFDQWAMTAAHRDLAFNTVVLVKNLNNGKTAKVRINDRGPFVRGRIIDLSRGAAEKVDMIRDGVVPVRVEILRRGG